MGAAGRPSGAGLRDRAGRPVLIGRTGVFSPPVLRATASPALLTAACRLAPEAPRRLTLPQQLCLCLAAPVWGGVVMEDDHFGLLLGVWGMGPVLFKGPLLFYLLV